jgi:DNA-binding transcriptional ArsR family regulator
VPDDPLSLTFAALADPTRRAILARLAKGEATVNELAEPFEISLQAVSKHLKVLERAGLITRGRDAQYRPCRFEAEPLDSAIGWIEQHRQVWTERFDKLEAHLRTLQNAGGPPATGRQRRAPKPKPRPKPNKGATRP